MALTPKQKRAKEIRELKDRERFAYRQRRNTWTTPTTDVEFRLTALILFIPDAPRRQLYNRCITSIGEIK